MVAKVYLVGAGPGDPSLISYKGMQALKKADVVLYDRLLNPLLLHLAPKSAELFYVGKSPERHALKQNEIEAEMIRLAEVGKTVVRLKGGDPAIFGRVAEEMTALDQAGIDYQVIPGITSASAVPVYGGFAVTERHVAEKVLICTPTAVLEEFAKEPLAQIASGGSVVIYMGMEKLPAIVELVLAQGAAAELPIAVIQWGTWGRQQKVVGSLSDIFGKVIGAKLTNPALIVVGPAAVKATAASWFEKLPHFGKQLVYVTSQTMSFDEMLTYTEEGYDLYVVQVGAAADERFIESHRRNLPDYQDAPVLFNEESDREKWATFKAQMLER